MPAAGLSPAAPAASAWCAPPLWPSQLRRPPSSRPARRRRLTQHWLAALTGLTTGGPSPMPRTSLQRSRMVFSFWRHPCEHRCPLLLWAVVATAPAPPFFSAVGTAQHSTAQPLGCATTQRCLACHSHARSVIWRDGTGAFRCLRDACPHRLVPLSDGRVAPNGELQCAYHGGWVGGEGGWVARWLFGAEALAWPRITVTIAAVEQGHLGRRRLLCSTRSPTPTQPSCTLPCPAPRSIFLPAGWQFKGCGTCTVMPQGGDPSAPRACATAFQCAEKQGLVWVKLKAPPRDGSGAGYAAPLDAAVCIAGAAAAGGGACHAASQHPAPSGNPCAALS